VLLPYADLNQALLGKHIDAMMQSEPQSSQAINNGYGNEIRMARPPLARDLVKTDMLDQAKRALGAK
jgi:NitT/TauT family transport system substrate-binding protein